jgi:glycosyltransferase involved in cell wall biosynthesis
MGRPVIVPHSNVGRFVRDGEEALVLPKVDALGIVDAIRHLRANKPLAERLAAGATEFCRKHFSWKNNAGALARFYAEVAAQAQTQTHVPTAPASK